MEQLCSDNVLKETPVVTLVSNLEQIIQHIRFLEQLDGGDGS